MAISVIIPTLAVDGVLCKTIRRVLDMSTSGSVQIIVSCYERVPLSAQRELVDMGVICTQCPQKGRAKQMNHGALCAQGSILYFLHADTLVQRGRDRYIIDAVSQGHNAGSFVLQFDHDHWFLRSQARWTRWNVPRLRFGDQSMFVTKELWQEVGGFDEGMTIEEDNDIARRLYKKTKWCIVDHPVITSAEKYLQYGIYRTQLIFYMIHILYLCGASQRILLYLYRFFKKHV